MNKQKKTIDLSWMRRFKTERHGMMTYLVTDVGDLETVFVAGQGFFNREDLIDIELFGTPDKTQVALGFRIPSPETPADRVAKLTPRTFGGVKLSNFFAIVGMGAIIGCERDPGHIATASSIATVAIALKGLIGGLTNEIRLLATTGINLALTLEGRLVPLDQVLVYGYEPKTDMLFAVTRTSGMLLAQKSEELWKHPASMGLQRSWHPVDGVMGVTHIGRPLRHDGSVIAPIASANKNGLMIFNPRAFESKFTSIKDEIDGDHYVIAPTRMHGDEIFLATATRTGILSYRPMGTVPGYATYLNAFQQADT